METIKSNIMKTLILFIGLTGIAAGAGAQVSSNALGVRFYGGDKFDGVEPSYQKGLNDRNRLELDASFGFKSDDSRVALYAIYHWDWVGVALSACAIPGNC